VSVYVHQASSTAARESHADPEKNAAISTDHQRRIPRVEDARETIREATSMLDHRGFIANVTSGTSAVVIDVST
jgi:hypothetical protein